MLCKNCGTEIKEGASFCHNCGSMIISTASVDGVSLNTQPAPEASVSEAPTAPQTAAPPQAPQAPQTPINPNFSAPVQNAPYGVPPTAPYQPIAPEATPRDNSGFSVAALVLGIIGVIPCCCGFNFIPSVLALIFGIISRKSQKGSMAIAGIVLGAIGIVVAIVIFIAYIYLMISGEGEALDGMYY